MIYPMLKFAKNSYLKFKTKERPPGTYMIWSMEAMGATCAVLYYLHLYTDLLKPIVRNRLDPAKYTPLILTQRQRLTPDTDRFRFQLNRPRYDSQEPETLVDQIIQRGSWAVDVKDHLVQTFRTYSPVEYQMGEEVDEVTGSREGYLDLVVKRYPNGSLSRFLHSTKVGDQVEVRGPILTWPWHSGRYRNIYMIAGGTGIAPMYQIIDRAMKEGDTKISLLYGSKRPRDIIYQQQLDQLVKKYGKERLEIRYLVDKADGTEMQRGVPDRHTVDVFLKGFEQKDVVLVCGPDKMLQNVCGKRPVGGSEQGPLGGVLKELGYRSDQVFKF